ncbi:Lipoprotein-anchoring transpeptidase ErfK/SrfK [Verrucomicrobium sp. GAS474]|nr:Lipoprotein-anchoring transpeptidase ErfK/SrfK [Verrucomicrobium sp. GAS474]
MVPPLLDFQVALERHRFSCGFIDGTDGDRSTKALRAYQESRGLPVTGVADAATWQALQGEGASTPLTTYTVTPEDVAAVVPVPHGWKEKAAAPTMGYTAIWDLLGEKFHAKRSFLIALNPGQPSPQAGAVLRVPALRPFAPTPSAAKVRIRLAERSIDVLDTTGKVVAHFPCSIAKDKEKRPSGSLAVKVIAVHPNYTFDPKLFADAAKAEGITGRLIIPPGPRNPVGAVWIGLSLPTYGIHGTPEPENVSRTQSHGCFRLANWNAEALAKMVRIGTPIDVEP